jgi:hypothetical protein
MAGDARKLSAVLEVKERQAQWVDSGNLQRDFTIKAQAGGVGFGLKQKP